MCVKFILVEVHVRFYTHFSVVRISPQISKFSVHGCVTCASLPIVHKTGSGRSYQFFPFQMKFLRVSSFSKMMSFVWVSDKFQAYVTKLKKGNTESLMSGLLGH